MVILFFGDFKKIGELQLDRENAAISILAYFLFSVGIHSPKVRERKRVYFFRKKEIFLDSRDLMETMIQVNKTRQFSSTGSSLAPFHPALYKCTGKCAKNIYQLVSVLYFFPKKLFVFENN